MHMIIFQYIMILLQGLLTAIIADACNSVDTAVCGILRATSGVVAGVVCVKHNELHLHVGTNIILCCISTCGSDLTQLAASHGGVETTQQMITAMAAGARMVRQFL